MYYSVKVKLDASSLKKFIAGKTVTVKNSINGSDVRFEFDESQKKIYTKLHNSLKSSKGARLNIDDVDAIYVGLEVWYEEVFDKKWG